MLDGRIILPTGVSMIVAIDGRYDLRNHGAGTVWTAAIGRRRRSQDGVPKPAAPRWRTIRYRSAPCRADASVGQESLASPSIEAKAGTKRITISDPMKED